MLNEPLTRRVISGKAKIFLEIEGDFKEGQAINDFCSRGCANNIYLLKHALLVYLISSCLTNGAHNCFNPSSFSKNQNLSCSDWPDRHASLEHSASEADIGVGLPI